MPGNARTNIAYGGARFPHSKKNWGRSVPTVSVRRACVRFFPQTVQVDEYRTSKVCPQCLSQLQKVLRRLEGERFPENQRGILRCPSIQCASCTFKNRDEVGARNILACHMAERRGDVRPGLLQRGFNQGWQANPKPSHACAPLEGDETNDILWPDLTRTRLGRVSARANPARPWGAAADAAPVGALLDWFLNAKHYPFCRQRFLDRG